MKKIFSFKEKTGMSEAAFGAFVGAGISGIGPFFGLDVSSSQALSIGTFATGIVFFILRQIYKAQNNDS